MLTQLSLLRSTFALVAVAILTSMAPAAAQAQETWLPAYSPDKHVYVDPLLSNSPQAPVRLDALESTLIQQGQKHGLKIFVVATQEGSDLARSDVPGRDALDKLILKWQARPGFPSDSYLVVVWVRRADNPNKGSVAANGGNQFSDWNMTGAYFADPQKGPVVPNLRRFMPQDPQGAFQAIVETVNGDIDAFKTKQAQEEANKAFNDMLPFYIGTGVLVLLVGGGLIFLFFRNSSRRKKAEALISDWQGKLDSANELYLKLRGSYMGFLTEQSDWKTKFKNRTLQSYTADCKDFAKFSARRKRANDLLTDAKKAFEGNRFPSVKGFNEVDALLDTRALTITGEDLPLEESTLFGGLVESKEYQPAALLEDMSNLFTNTNQALAGIVSAFSGAKKNKVDVEKLDQSVNEQRKDVTEAGLTMAPYEPTIADLKKGQTDFIAILSSDPLEAFAGSEAVEQGFTKLGQRLVRAIDIKKSLPGVKDKIDLSEQKAKGKRSELVAYAYPLATSETAPQEAVPSKFRLDESEYNPDMPIAHARRCLASAMELVLAGMLDESDRSKEEALTNASSASKMVDEVMSAKRSVELTIPSVRTADSALDNELAPAGTALAELERDFLAKNIEGQPAHVSSGHAVKKQAPTNLSSVKTLYDAQRYIAARTLMLSTQSSISSARTALVNVHNRLKELTRLRQDSRDTVVTGVKTAAKIARKLKENPFTTSAATDKAFDEASKKLTLQKAETDKKIADWPTVNQKVHEVIKAFDGFDAAIDLQATQYGQAQTDVRQLAAAVLEANRYVSNPATTQETRDAYNRASTTFSYLSTELTVAKSNWVEISENAKVAKRIANDSQDAAELEISQCADADRAYDAADGKIAQVSRQEYSYAVTPDLRYAQDLLRESTGLYRGKKYSQAAEKARAAFRAAEEADQAAERLAAERHADAVKAAALARAAEEALRNQNNGGGGNHGGGGGGGGGIFPGNGGGGFPGGGIFPGTGGIPGGSSTTKRTDTSGGDTGGGGGDNQSTKRSESGGGQIQSDTGGGSYNGRSGGGNY